MTIEQLHAEWMEWVAPLMAGTPKSDLAWMAWQAGYRKASSAWLLEEQEKIKLANERRL